MEKTKLSFAIDATQIDIKPLLRKDFLELSMKAISSANPNRNNSWFTRESMERSIDSFRNKPILGYFENGDFVSHNGEWSSDPETQMEYWDTLGKKGERILGLIRSEDEVKIVEDENGLSWICLSCALWTQYSFKQVKRLLKDAKKAKQTGESTKNVSVEVDITDYEMLPNGVMKINAFNLIGITILGSRNGVKVEPGIEDAELSVVDIMGKDLYERQAHSIRLAYEKLSNSTELQKEDDSQMIIEENNEKVEIQESSVESSEVVETKQEFDVQVEEAEKVEAQDTVVAEEAAVEHLEEEDHKEEEPHEEGCPCQEEKEEEQPKEEEKPEEDHEPEQCEEVCLEEQPVEEKPEEEHCEEEKPEEEKPEEEHCEEQPEECEVKCEDEKYTALEAEYNELKTKYESVCSELQKYKKAEFLAQAKELIAASKIADNLAEKYYSACESDEISSIDDLKVKVALSVLDSTIQTEETNFETSAIATPDTKSAFESKDSKVKKTGWATIQEYIGK